MIGLNKLHECMGAPPPTIKHIKQRPVASEKETEGLDIGTKTKGLDTKGASLVEAACCSYQKRQ